jgi:acyl-CoA synthetase (NDP forming)
LLAFFVFQDSPIDEGIQEVMPKIAKLGKPVLCWAAGGPYTRKQVRALEANGIPVYESGERIAVAAHTLIQRWHLARADGFAKR